MTEIIDFDVSGGRAENWYFSAKHLRLFGRCAQRRRESRRRRVSLVRKTAHHYVVQHTRITAPLPSIAIIVIAIVMIVEVEHLEQVSDGRAVAGHIRIMLMPDRVWQVVAAARRERLETP